MLICILYLKVLPEVGSILPVTRDCLGAVLALSLEGTLHRIRSDKVSQNLSHG